MNETIADLWRREAKGNGVGYRVFWYRIKQGYPYEEAVKNECMNVLTRPDYFTKEWYLKKKEHKYDKDIAAELFVTGQVLRRWKGEVL